MCDASPGRLGSCLRVWAHAVACCVGRVDWSCPWNGSLGIDREMAGIGGITSSLWSFEWLSIFGTTDWQVLDFFEFCIPFPIFSPFTLYTCRKAPAKIFGFLRRGLICSPEAALVQATGSCEGLLCFQDYWLRWAWPLSLHWGLPTPCNNR